jgi:hypothetical protein
MGLDMYLYKKTYVKNWEHMKPEEKHTITVKKDGKVVKSINHNKIAYIVEDAGYWRKANAIHKWFIDNCANGDGDRSTMYVDSEQLQELLDTVNKVLDGSKLVKGKVVNGQTSSENGWVDNLEDGEIIEDSTLAEELLPTQSGFFFGGTNYDQYYIADLKHTKEVLEEALKDYGVDGHYPEFEYHASW